MKYKTLTSSELASLEKEFIDYLIINGITADQWEEIKKKYPSEAEKIIDLFSDVVFEDIMRKVKFLEFRSPYDVKVFQCLQESIVMVGLSVPKNVDINLTDPHDLKKLSTSPPEEAEVYTSEKKYSTTRELEIFNMVEQGCVISDEKLFTALCLSLPEA